MTHLHHLIIIQKNYTMKYFTLLATFLMVGMSATAQQFYYEDFENGMPADYHLVNVDGLTPDDPDLVGMADTAWTVRFISAQGWTNGNSAFSVSWYQNDAGPSDDWMITPAIQVGVNAILSWNAMAITSSGNFRDRYQVFIGTDTTLASFAALAPVFDTGDTGEVDIPMMRIYDLATNGYENQTIHIAFRNFTQPYNPSLPQGPGNGGNELAIDNIDVSNTISTQSRTLNINEVKVFPNPVSEVLTLNLELTESDNLTAYIIGVDGKVMLSQQLGQIVTGEFQTTFDVSNLVAGNYFLQIEGQLTKVVKQITIK